MGECLSAGDVVRHVESRQRVFVHGGAATPRLLLDALVEQADRLVDVELMHLHTEGNAKYADAKFEGHFRVTNLFIGHNIRPYMHRGRVDYLPCFLSEMPRLVKNTRKPDVVLLSLSPPDERGYCTLGTSVDVAKAALQTAKLKLAQINDQMPRVHGDGYVHISEVDYFVRVSEPLPELACHEADEVEIEIGQKVAGLVEDGSCLQIGIGGVPNAVLRALANHRHLGIHSEMWSDGALELIRSGVVDNSLKQNYVGKNASTFILGSKAVYDFIDNNPGVIQLGADQINNPAVIAQNPNVVAVNSAIEIDLTGQVCADSIGPRLISGVGGQMDFMRGAQLSENGKSIIALTSRTKTGKPRIVPLLTKGAGVVTTRADIRFVVTENGVADLFGKTLDERAKSLIAIAHPGDRDSLAAAWNQQ